MSRRAREYVARCSTGDCQERIVKSTDDRRPWTCTRHREPEKVLAPGGRITTTVTAAKSKRSPHLAQLFWREGDADDVGSAFVYGPGFYLFANDFNEGDVVTVEITATTNRPPETDEENADG